MGAVGEPLSGVAPNDLVGALNDLAGEAPANGLVCDADARFRVAADAPSLNHVAGRRTAVLLDPHPLWLAGVRAVLESIGVEVVATATAADHAVALVREHAPDLLIAEVQTSGGTREGISCLARACREVAGLRVIVFSGAADPGAMTASFQAGALVYLLKSADVHDIASAVRQTFTHSMHFPPRAATATATALEGATQPKGLTARELETLKLAAHGYSNVELARRLWVSEQTVKFHLSNVYRKLEVANRTEASRWAERHGLLDPRDGPVLSEEL